MTPNEAAKQRIPRIRKPEWHSGAYLRIPLLTNGMVGPWAELYDEPGQLACGVPIGSQRLLMTGSGNDPGYEKYEGSPHEAEQNNYAKTYAES